MTRDSDADHKPEEADLPREVRTSGSSPTMGSSSGQLDWEAIVKISQALSSEIVLPRLIEKLVRIAVEYAGAERGLLILIRDGAPWIEAEAGTGPGGVEVTVRHAAVTPSDLPQSVLLSVIQTTERVLLEDASTDDVHSTDEYVRQKHSRSILCLPIVHQAKLVGALYLENDRAPGAFTPDRVTLLQLLASRAAISLENASLFSNLELQAGLLQHLPVSAWTLKPNGTPDFVNRVWLEVAGQTLDAVRSRPDAWMTAVHPEDREVVAKEFWRGVSTGQDFAMEARTLRAQDQTYRWHLHQAVVLRDAEGKVLKFVGTSTDIDDQKRVGESLAALDRAKTTFFSNVSHEFRTPLTLMLGPLEELQNDAREQLSPERREMLVTVHRNGLRLLKLVNTLLDFSRIEAGRTQASYEPTDLAAFTAEIASAFDSALQNAGLHFSVECQPIAEPVYVDRDMWEKIVLNLLSNAYKFTFKGEVALTLKQEDGVIELQVRDTGVGIPEEHRGRVFERFHRIENVQARTHEGTGIGLALVQELVKLHGGTVRVESTLGAGSTFTVTIPRGKDHLPAERIQATRSLAPTTIRAEAYIEDAATWSGLEPGAAADAENLGKLRPPTSSTTPAPAGKRELIVLADDNADMRQYLMRLLSDRYEVHAVADGRQALETTQQLRPALVLADVMMPQLDGFGLLRAIREDSALASTPVILVSARAGEESRVEGLEADADDYLVKPFAARELLARVAVHVKMANLRREAAEREERLRSEAELEREKLRASEERLAETNRLYGELQLQVELLQRLPVSAWTLKPDGTPDFVNRVWLEVAGQTLDFVRSSPEAWMTAVHPEDREAVAKEFWRGVQSGQDFAMEARTLRARDGTYRWHLHRAIVLRDADGKVLKFVGTSTDINDQKRAEEKFRESEYEARLTVDSIPGLVALVSPTGNLEMVSRQALEFFGRTIEELRGWGTNDTIHPEDLPGAIEAFSGAIASGRPYEFPARFRRSDGVYRWFQDRGFPRRDKNGNIARWYLLITDIDDQKRAEEALRESEHEARLIVDSIPGLIAVLNVNGEIERVSQPIVDYFGRSLEELRQWAVDDTIHPDDRPRYLQAFQRAFAAGDPFEHEVRIRRFDGVYRWFNMRGHPLRDRQGHIVRWYFLLTEVDDRKRAEEALRQTQGDLARINRVTTMGELAASLAHEINQPISGAMTNANACLRMLGRDQPDLEEMRAAVTRIVRDAERAARIIDRIRSQFQKSSTKQETVDVNEAIREIVALLRTEAVRYNIAVRAELAADLPQIVGDRVQLQQVAMNLLVNSIEAMKDVQGVREMVVHSQRAEDEQILVSVSDTGIGLPPQLAEQIFDPFFTTKPHGTGMGLRISRSIIQSHGGRLWATANDGPGATFSFSIPRSRQA